jgi:phosphoglycerate dehydrogenase-like enzyme
MSSPTPLRVLVVSPDGADALAGTPELEAVVVDPGDPSTWPEQARAVVAGGRTPDELEPLLAGVQGIEVVQLLSAGVEGWVGRLPAGVDLVNARGAHGGATAEWAVAALLAVRRELPLFGEQQRRRTWAAATSPGLQGAHVVVVGAGDLGEQTRRRLDGFDARTTLVARSAREGVRAMADLPELLPTADAVVLVVPLTDETRGLVDAGFLAALPDGSVVVNAARGSVVDTAALLAEVASGRLRAALDVTDPEPLPSDHPLWTVPGVLLTPHVGGDTEGSGERAWRVAREQLLQLAGGERPANTVGQHY